MPSDKMHEKSPLWMSGSYATKGLVLRRAIVDESLSRLTKISVEFLSENKAIKLEELLGQTLTLNLRTAQENLRKFTGTIISVEEIALRDGYGHYLAEVRPWFWLLKRTLDSRIFQELKADDIIKQVFSDQGFTDFKFRTTKTLEVREYCVQYRESDFDFVCRLMEEEGLYYYFEHKDSGPGNETLVIADGATGHDDVPEESELTFYAGDDARQRLNDHVSEWASAQVLTSSKVSLEDFDFLTPSTELEVLEKTLVSPKHKYTKFELYDYPGHYRKNTGLGKERARVRMEAEAIRHERFRGKSTVRTLGTGKLFKLKGRDSFKGKEWLAADAIYHLQTTSGYEFVKRRQDLDVGPLEFPDDMTELFLMTFGAYPKQTQFRAPLETPWPEIPSMHTAIVTGKKGEEIWTDEHGRIKVQFHWDRDGKMDEKTTCWVRVATPWSGKNWGMIHVPRIGQEVVIQFEEGDPDRPICTGMLYNKETMPPYKLPDNATQTGIKTNSSKGGGGFNELMMEDKKDEELVRFQAEKDYQQIVKNNADITIGLEKQDEGNLTQTVQNNQTETIVAGDHTFTVEQGSKTLSIKQDKTQTIEGNHTKTVTGDDSTTIQQGNKSTTVSSGNMTVDVSMGKITITAMQSIELKVGSSSVKLDQSGVTIKGMMIKAKATAMAEVKGPMTTVKGDGMLTLKGGITMIN